MLSQSNPFTPTFGRTPKVVVGRDVVLDALARGLDSPDDPYRMTWLRAARGVGKTVLLNEAQDMATDRGWLVVQEDAQSSGSLCARITNRLVSHLAEQDPPAHSRYIARLKIGPVEVERQARDLPALPPTLRSTMEAVLDAGSPPTGIMLSVDEIHSATSEDLHELGNAVQHLHRDRRPIAVLFAGLPAAADDPPMPTFLTRCMQPDIHQVDDSEIERGFVETAAASSATFAPDALALAVRSTAGYPYMLQLVGYHAWNEAPPAADGRRTITAPQIRSTVAEAERQLARSVMLDVDRRLSPQDRAFLLAMAHDNGSSRMRDLASRLHQGPQYVNMYRVRLLESGLITQTGRGRVDFAFPGHRAMLRSTPQFTEQAELLRRGADMSHPSGPALEP